MCVFPINPQSGTTTECLNYLWTYDGYGWVRSSGGTASNGITGSQGIQGVTGPTGSQGIQGVTGPTGSQGIQGNTGPTGSQGIQGNTGATGAIPTNYVISFNGLTGAVGITAGSNITLTPVGNIITISSSGGGVTAASNFTEGITAPSTPTKGDQWFNTADGGLYTAITDDSGVIWTQLNGGILGPTGPTGNTNLSAGAGITISNGVIGIDTVNGVTFTGPIAGSTLYLTGDLIVTGQIVTSTGIFGSTSNALIESVDNMIMDGGEF